MNRGDRVGLALPNGRISWGMVIDVSWDGEIRVKFDSDSDPGMWYPPQALLTADQLEGVS